MASLHGRDRRSVILDGASGNQKHTYLETVETNFAPQVNGHGFGAFSPVGMVLDDRSSTGRRRPWREHKAEGKLIAASYGRIAERTGDSLYRKLSERVSECGERLDFLTFVDPRTGEVAQRLAGARFCHDRLCPLCAWRKSLAMFNSVKRCMSWIDEKCGRDRLVPLFLTLTVRNCAGDDLRGTIGVLSRGWTKLMKSRRVERFVRGYFRSVEVTRNGKTGGWHPHIHALLLVSPEYLNTAAGLYMTQDEWTGAWKVAAGLEYKPIVHVSMVYGNRDEAIAEVAKYAVKPGDWVSDDLDEMDKNVHTLHEALRGLRLTSWGGVLKEARAALKIGDVEDEGADLVHVGDDAAPEGFVLVRIERYRWSRSRGYVCTSVENGLAGCGGAVAAREGPRAA